MLEVVLSPWKLLEEWGLVEQKAGSGRREEISGDLEGIGAVAKTTWSVLEETTGYPDKGGSPFEEVGLVNVNPPIDFNGTAREFDRGGNEAAST